MKGSKVMVYLTTGLEGVQDLPKANVACDFTPRSFELRITGLNGANVGLARSDLAHDIVPDKSRVRVKKDRVVIIMPKANPSDMWLKAQEDPKKRTASKKSSSPEGDIMSLMKNMCGLLCCAVWGCCGGTQRRPWRSSHLLSLAMLWESRYDDGDPDMKRTIAEAWSKAQESRATGDSLAGSL